MNVNTWRIDLTEVFDKLVFETCALTRGRLGGNRTNGLVLVA